MGDGLRPEAQQLDRIFAFVQLLLGGSTLQRRHVPPHLYIGGQQLQKNIQSGNGPAGGHIEAFPAGGHGLLGSGRDAVSGNAQLRQDLLQPGHPLAQAVQQCHIRIRAGNGNGHPGKARPAAHVNEPLALQIQAPGQRQAVQQVQLGHLDRVCNGGEIHDLVLFNYRLAEGAEDIRRVVRQHRLKARQSGFQRRFHFLIDFHAVSFNRWRPGLSTGR